MTLREYSRHRKALGLSGGTLRAVQAAIATGRLSDSLTPAGQIRNAAEADLEWAGSTFEDRVPLTGPTSAPSGPASSTLQHWRARREAALAERAELELGILKDEFAPVAEIRAAVITAYTIVRTKLLGVPSRLRQRDATFTREQVDLVDALIRDALEALADSEATP